MQHIQLQVPEFEKNEKPFEWHVIAGLFVGALIVIAWRSENYAFIAFLAIAAAALAISDSRTPRTVPFRIDNDMVTFDRRKWLLDDLEAFSLLSRDESTAYLILHPKTTTFRIAAPKIIVTEPKAVQASLQNHLKEVRYEEPLIEILARLLRL